MLFFFASPRILNAPMVKKKESLYAIGGVNKVSKKLPTFNGCQLEKSLPFFFFSPGRIYDSTLWKSNIQTFNVYQDSSRLGRICFLVAGGGDYYFCLCS